MAALNDGRGPSGREIGAQGAEYRGAPQVYLQPVTAAAATKVMDWPAGPPSLPRPSDSRAPALGGRPPVSGAHQADARFSTTTVNRARDDAYDLLS